MLICIVSNKNMESGQGYPEDMPIVSRGIYEMYSEFPEESHDIEETGPLNQRAASKNWKTRSQAYHEILEDLKLTQSFPTYSSSLHKFLSDSNPNPQEKALEILSYYLTNSSASLLYDCESITRALIEKHISGARNSFKEKAKELLSSLYLVDKERVLGELLKYIEHKNIKFQVSSLSAINCMIKTLGSKVFNFRSVIPYIERSAENSNISIRTEALNFYKELYRYLRNGIEPYIVKLKKQQQDEMNKCFEEMQLDKTEDLNVYEFLDSKDIFTTFNDRWADGVLAMEKWSEKKEALEELNNEANFPKLAEKSAGVLVGMAKRLINDSNIAVVVQAIRLIGFLARGQGKFFDSHARAMVPILFAKFKEKKQQVIQEIHKTLENLMHSTNIDSILGHVELALQDKAVATRLNTTIWIEKTGIWHICAADAAKQVLEWTKINTEDSNPEVRDAAYALLKGLIQKYPGLEGLISDIPAVKLKKIAVGTKSEANISVKQKAIENSNVKQRKIPEATGNISSQGNKITTEKVENNEIGDQDTVIPSHILQNLKEKSWKSKQTGLQDLNEFLNEPIDSIELLKIHSYIIKILNNFKENNPNIVKSGLECLFHIYSITTIPEDYAKSILTSTALDKLSEAKVSELYRACILSVCEIATPDFTTKCIIKNIAECTKPKTVSECFDLLGTITKDFGVAYINIKLLVDQAKNGLSQTNPMIKKSASGLLGILYAFKGPQILECLDGLKDTVISGLKEEFSKNPVQLPSALRKCRGKVAVPVSAELIQKVNIAGLVTPQLLKDLSDANWKIRKESLESIDAIITKKKVAAKGLADLIRQLKNRLADPNKVIIKFTLTLLGKLADSLGSDASGYCRVVVPHIISNLADKQALLRQEAKSTLQKWGENCGAESIISLAGPLLSQDNPELRLDLLSWILSNKESIRNADIKSLIPGVLGCLQDRIAGIRNQAEFLFGEIVELTGFEPIQPYLKDIKPAFLKSLQAIFDKYLNDENKASRRGRTGMKRIHSRIGKVYEFRTTDKEKDKDKDRDKDKDKEKDKKNRGDIARWIFDEMRPDQLESIRGELKNSTSEEMCVLLFNTDFNKKLHACDAIKGMIDHEHFTECLNLVFKWFFLELAEGNTQVLKSILELILIIFQSLRTRNYSLSDLEAEILIPSLCEKISMSNNFYQHITHNILKETIACYSGESFFSLIICSLGLKTVSKPECLQEIFDLYRENRCIISGKDIKTLGGYLRSQDCYIRSTTIKILTEIYSVMGKKIIELIGPGNEKVVEILMKSNKDTESFESIHKSQLSQMISDLNFGDLQLKVNALHFLSNQVLPNIHEYSEEINTLTTDLVTSLCKGFRDLCSMPIRSSPKDYTVVLLSIANYLFSTTNILAIISYDLLKNIYETFISRASDFERELKIQTEISNLLLSLLEYSNINDSLDILISLLDKTKENSRQLQVNIKCILKLSKCLPHFCINPEVILLAIHKQLVINIHNTNEFIVKVLKTLLQELVFLIGEDIWSYYSGVSAHQTKDNFISSWITDILKNRYPVVKIFKKLLCPEKYAEGVKEIYHYIKENKDYDINFIMKRHPEISLKLQQDLEQISRNASGTLPIMVTKTEDWAAIRERRKKQDLETFQAINGASHHIPHYLNK